MATPGALDAVVLDDADDADELAADDAAELAADDADELATDDADELTTAFGASVGPATIGAGTEV